MKLHEYLRTTGESQRAFSRRSGLGRLSLQRIEVGADALGDTWARIERATGGCVTRADYFAAPTLRPFPPSSR